MNEYINSKAERLYGDMYFRNFMSPPKCFDYRAYKKIFSPYWHSRGFGVSMMYNAFFSAYSGVESDRYLSPDLYFMYIVPALNRMEFKKAYSDKSFYPELFPKVRQPEIVVFNAGGRYYDSSRSVISKDDAVKLCLHEKLIIKPSVDTGEGHGVDLLDSKSSESIARIFSERENGSGFLVSRFLRQHADMGRMNESSLNTMRLFTYRRLNGEIVNLSRQNFLRFGGAGAWKDNVSCDGGFCHVHSDGMLDGRIMTKSIFGTVPFCERFPFKPFVVPSFDKAIDFVKRLHAKLLYFDSIGWDVAIAEDGEPTLVEFNIDANLRSAQMVGGPMYGEYLDEVMDRVNGVRKIHVGCEVNIFKYGYDRWTQIEGPEYDVL